MLTWSGYYWLPRERDTNPMMYRVSQKKRSLSFLAIISGLNAAIVAFKDSFELVRFSAFF